MTDTRYDVLFSGELKPEADPFAVRARIQELFKLSDQAANQLFSGKTIAVKRDLDLAKATKFRKAFLQAGAFVAVVEKTTGPAAEQKKAEQPPAKEQGNRAQGLTLAATNSGPLEADNSAFAAREIDTSHLSLVTGNNWSLEDAAPTLPPVALPDISHLSLVEPEPEEDGDGEPDESR